MTATTSFKQGTTISRVRSSLLAAEQLTLPLDVLEFV